MKKFYSMLLIALCCFVFLVGCCETDDNSDISLIKEFQFTLTPEALLNKLTQKNINIVSTFEQQSRAAKDNGIYNPVLDGRTYNYDGSFWYECEDASFCYDMDGQLERMIANSKRYITKEGIRVGDSREKVFSAYPNMLNDQAEIADGYLVFGFESAQSDSLAFWSYNREADPNLG